MRNSPYYHTPFLLQSCPVLSTRLFIIHGIKYAVYGLDVKKISSLKDKGTYFTAHAGFYQKMSLKLIPFHSFTAE